MQVGEAELKELSVHVFVRAIPVFVFQIYQVAGRYRVAERCVVVKYVPEPSASVWIPKLPFESAVLWRAMLLLLLRRRRPSPPPATPLPLKLLWMKRLWLLSITATPCATWPATTLSRNSLSVAAVPAMVRTLLKSAALTIVLKVFPDPMMVPVTTIPRMFPVTTTLFTRERCTF